jgi:hypothetical protein
MTFDELAEFNKDLKSLLKKYRTLNDDLNIVKKVLEVIDYFGQCVQRFRSILYNPKRD